MTNRTSRVMVTLGEPLQIGELDLPIPAGRYEVTVEEEPVGDLMFSAYRRISASIYLPRVPGRVGVGQAVALDQSELDMLLGRVEGGVP